ncbi:hypothetical protein [Natrinema ejinorense]|uniref:hypothetical protein n=1 Tax=Natrinema ejinorense TaxID=373386 RepID=UPI00117D8FBA|nr:hypothetical protein [Natrinema ejinorense]
MATDQLEGRRTGIDRPLDHPDRLGDVGMVLVLPALGAALGGHPDDRVGNHGPEYGVSGDRPRGNSGQFRETTRRVAVRC